MFDIIIIGAGPAGYKLAEHLSTANKSICIIEKNKGSIGGTCLHEGCVPTKHFLEIAGYIKKRSYFKSLGLNHSIKFFDIEELKHSTQNLIRGLHNDLLNLLKK